MIQAKIQLPIFSGFYETIYDYTLDAYLERNYSAINQDEMDENEFEIVMYSDEDKLDARNSIAKSITKNFIELTNQHLNLLLDLEFVEMYSPREYNFSTDQIICNLKLTQEQYTTIINKLKEKQEEFQKYLTKYFTSSDGYVVFVSNKVKDWLVDFNNLQRPEGQLSEMLEFLILSSYSNVSVTENINLLKNDFNDVINSLIYSDLF